MPSTQASSDSSETDINLKHRLTGAAVLIFFGALFLPWLLGPPSEAKKVVTEVEEVSKRVHSTFEDDVLAQLQEDSGQSDFVEPEETVYISKITPVNGKNVASDPEPLNAKTLASDDGNKAQAKPEKTVSNETAKGNSETKANVVKPTIAKTSSAKSDVVRTQTVETQVVKSTKTKAKVKDTIPTSASNSSDLATGLAAKGNAGKSELVTQKVEEATTNASIKPTPQIVAKPKVVDKPKEIDVGWIVQVELLTDKRGAQKLVESLKDKNFDPKTTIVDTNKGKATGTRIWVGPFESRKQANAENDRLETKMGKRGFIRVYP